MKGPLKQEKGSLRRPLGLLERLFCPCPNLEEVPEDVALVLEKVSSFRSPEVFVSSLGGEMKHI